MARTAGIEWKAVGASLDDLARTMRSMPANAPGAIAYASSGVLQQAGVVMLARYITPASFAQSVGKNNRLVYAAPPGATHGKIRKTHKRPDGTYVRNDKGQFVDIVIEEKLFIKGKFVSRTGQMKSLASDLARTAPTESVKVVLSDCANQRNGDSGKIEAGIDAHGNGYVELTGGYRAAEVGSRGKTNGVKGWYRALRSVQGRWATLIRKKYPELARVKVGR